MQKFESITLTLKGVTELESFRSESSFTEPDLLFHTWSTDMFCEFYAVKCIKLCYNYY